MSIYFCLPLIQKGLNTCIFLFSRYEGFCTYFNLASIQTKLLFSSGIDMRGDFSVRYVWCLVSVTVTYGIDMKWVLPVTHAVSILGSF